MAYVLAADRGDNIVWRCSQQLGNDRELVDVILSGEEWLALQHFCEDASSTPDVHLHIVLLPGEHNFWCSVVSRRDVAGHLRVLNSRKTEVTDLQIAVLVHEDVGRLQIAMNDTGRMYVFQSALYRSAAIL